MGRPRRLHPRLAASTALVAIVACAATAALAAAPAQAASHRSCALSLRDQEPPGRTPAYNLRLERVRTSCALAVRVMKAFHACRTASGRSCRRRLLGSWRCAGRLVRGTTTNTGSFRCSSRGRRVRGSYWQDTPTCFGAAARDPKRRCYNRTRRMFPPPGRPDPDLSWQCDETVVAGACVFGMPPSQARRHVAIIGDSHVFHWRPAMLTVLGAERWAGYSFSAGGCFFSEAVGSFAPGCEGWYRDIHGWLVRHPEVSIVFVTSNADTPIPVPPGSTMLDAKVDGLRRAWKALPRTVRKVVVLRDTTRSTQATLSCIARVASAGRRRLATACPLARRVALRDDAAVETVRRLRSRRYDAIDLSRFMCSRRKCYPVVGGVLVNGDVWGHLNPTFMRTLGPYLLREVRRVLAR